MKVWVLLKCENYEGGFVQGVFDSEDKALEAEARLVLNRGPEYSTIEEWEVK